MSEQEHLKAVADAIPVYDVPDAYFEWPADADESTKLMIRTTVDELPGQIVAVIAPAGRCLVDGNPNDCFQVADLQADDPDLDLVHQGATVVNLASGETLPTASIPLGVGHAPLHLTGESARAWMNDTTNTLGRVRFGYHDFGNGPALVAVGVAWPEVVANPRVMAGALANPTSLDARSRWLAVRQHLKEQGRYYLAGAVSVVIPGMPLARAASLDVEWLTITAAPGDREIEQQQQQITSQARQKRQAIYQRAKAQLDALRAAPRGSRGVRRQQILAQRSSELARLREETKSARQRLREQHRQQSDELRSTHRTEREQVSDARRSEGDVAAAKELKAAAEQARSQREQMAQDFADRLSGASSPEEKAAIRAERAQARADASDQWRQTRAELQGRTTSERGSRRLERRSQDTTRQERQRTERRALSDRQRAERQLIGALEMETTHKPGDTVVLDDGSKAVVKEVGMLDGQPMLLLEDGTIIDIDMLDDEASTPPTPATPEAGAAGGCASCKTAAAEPADGACCDACSIASRKKKPAIAAVDGADPAAEVPVPDAGLSEEQLMAIAERVAAIIEERQSKADAASQVHASLVAEATALGVVSAAMIVTTEEKPSLNYDDEVKLPDGRLAYAVTEAKRALDGSEVVEVMVGLDDDSERIVAPVAQLSKTGRRRSVLWTNDDEIVVETSEPPAVAEPSADSPVEAEAAA